jgi:hypothetical protein
MCPPNKMVIEFADAIAPFIMNNQFEKAKEFIDKEPHNKYFIYLRKISFDEYNSKEKISEILDESIKQSQDQQFLGLVIMIPSITEEKATEMNNKKTLFKEGITAAADYMVDQGIIKNHNKCLNTIDFNKFYVNKDDDNIYYLAMYYKPEKVANE